MISFTCDYCEGAHPRILEALQRTNMVQEQGYGEDSFCASAKANFFEEVLHEGKMVPRFQPISEEEAVQELAEQK